MKYTLMMMKGQNIGITDEEYRSIISAIESDKKLFFLKRTGEAISLRPAPSILLSARVEQNERQKLMESGRWKCDDGTVHRIGDQCFCWQHGGYLPEQIAEQEFQKLAAPEQEKAKMKALEYEKVKEKLLGSKKIPGLNYEEQLQARAEGGEKRAQAILSSE